MLLCNFYLTDGDMMYLPCDSCWPRSCPLGGLSIVYVGSAEPEEAKGFAWGLWGYHEHNATANTRYSLCKRP